MAYGLLLDKYKMLKSPNFAKIMKPLSIARSAEAIVLVSKMDPVNIHSRIWVPSLPVLHLSMIIFERVLSILNSYQVGEHTVEIESWIGLETIFGDKELTNPLILPDLV